MKKDNILSVLIDESGDFGKLDYNDPYYYVLMVLHEQDNSIADMVNALFSDVEIRKALPTNYRLLQVADLLCTVEMIADKEALSKSEDEFSTLNEILRRIFSSKLKRKECSMMPVFYPCSVYT